MPYRPSLGAIQARARAEASRLQARAQQVARDNQRRMEQRVRTLSCNGTRPLTKAQRDQLARESASYMRSRLK